MAIYYLTRRAAADIVDILEHSETAFGAFARVRYEALLETALRDLGNEPNRIGVLKRNELGPDIRTYHLVHSRGRARGEHGPVRTPRHLIVFRAAAEDQLTVLRVLHDAMDLERHLPGTHSTNEVIV